MELTLHVAPAAGSQLGGFGCRLLYCISIAAREVEVGLGPQRRGHLLGLVQDLDSCGADGRTGGGKNKR